MIYGIPADEFSAMADAIIADSHAAAFVDWAAVHGLDCKVCMDSASAMMQGKHLDGCQEFEDRLTAARAASRGAS